MAEEDFDVRLHDGRYICHRPRDMECIYVSSESDTEMSDGDHREALTQRMQP